MKKSIEKMFARLSRNRLGFFLASIMALPAILITGAALSANKNVTTKPVGLQSLSVEDNVHIYKGAIVCTNTSGFAVPAADIAGYKYAGIAAEECDNTLAGHTQGGKNVRVDTPNRFLLTATGMAQTSIGKMVYVTDDSAVALTSTNFVAVGKVVDYVSSTSVWVIGQPDVTLSTDPQNPFVNLVTKTDNYNVLVGDSGNVFAIATDAKVFSLPATAAGLVYTFVNTGADGAVLMAISPQNADGISGGGLATGVVNKDLLNTKATAKQFDFVTLVGTGNAGAGAWIITRKYGVFAAEA